jgi:hypothetical protein
MSEIHRNAKRAVPILKYLMNGGSVKLASNMGEVVLSEDFELCVKGYRILGDKRESAYMVLNWTVGDFIRVANNISEEEFAGVVAANGLRKR